MPDLAYALSARGPDLLVAIFCSLVATIVLRAGPRKPANQFFAFFLALIAGNFLMGFFLYGFFFQSFPHPDFPVSRVLARVALQLQIFDPAALLYFALLFPRRHPFLSRPASAVAVFGPALAFTALHLAVPWLFLPYALHYPAEPSAGPAVNVGPLGAAVEFYLMAFYLLALGRLLLALGAEENRLLRDQLALLSIGFGAAILPRLGILVALLLPPLGLTLLATVFTQLFSKAGPTLLVFAGAYAFLARHTPPERWPDVRRAFRWMSLLIGVIVGAWAVEAALAFHQTSDFPEGRRLLPLEGGVVDVVVPMLGSLAFSLRWVTFSVVVGYALLKYQVFDVASQLRRFAQASAGVAVVLAVAGAGWAGAEAAAPLVQGLGPQHVLALALAVIAAPPLVRWAGRRAGARFPAPATGEAAAARRLELYRVALERSIQGETLEGETELRAVRRDLGITDEQHEVLLSIARAERGGRRPAARDAQGRLAGRYEMAEVLGQGSFGRCWRARDALLGRAVVVKEVPNLGDERGLLKEARAAGRLNHPNIVTVHDVLEGPSVSYLVMEYAQGGSLRARLERGPPTTGEAVRLLEGIVAGLEAAHGAGIVHGDLKPENILLTSEGRPKLADFGSAYSTASSQTLASLPSKAGPGTLLYMAPEQVQGSDATPHSDLYAVAAMAYELLVGRHYLELRGKDDFQLREAILRAAPPLPKDLPPAVRDWLQRGLAKAPDARWADAGKMRAALQAAAGSIGVAASPGR